MRIFKGPDDTPLQVIEHFASSIGCQMDLEKMRKVAAIEDAELHEYIEDLNDFCRGSHSGTLLFDKKRKVAAEQKLLACIKESVATVLADKVTKQSMADAKKAFINATLEFWEEPRTHRKATVEFWGMGVPVEARATDSISDKRYFF